MSDNYTVSYHLIVLSISVTIVCIQTDMDKITPTCNGVQTINLLLLLLLLLLYQVSKK